MSWITAVLGGSERLSMKDAQNPLDMVISAAGLVSNVREIDPVMDRVRQITARIQPGEPLSREDEQALMETYLKIEGYLATREPLRTFTKQDLRKHLTPALREGLNNIESAHHPS